MTTQNGFLLEREYAIHHGGEWHVATWDGTHFVVISDFQSGDRWAFQQIAAVVLLPDMGRSTKQDYYAGAVDPVLREASINADRTAGVSAEDLATMRAMDAEYMRQRRGE